MGSYTRLDPGLIIHGGGEMGRLVREKNWAQTPLGPIESWPQSLRTTVSLCLASNFPISIARGSQRVQIYNATRVIRADRRFWNLPIVAMTAQAMNGDYERSLDAGMNDHVTKPVHPDRLTEILLKRMPASVHR